MADDGDPGPGSVEPHAAFYGLWPRITDPAVEIYAAAPGEEPSPED
jgi:hypothetical protein